ncbi:MAG: GNAT family N-acetyltransferase [Steroidobacteraceae bacterium]
MYKVIDNTARQRFEMEAEGDISFIDYYRQGKVLVMTHAEVPHEMNGRGLGTAMVKGALDIVREREEKVIPSCPFVAIYIRRHPEYQSLLS